MCLAVPGSILSVENDGSLMRTGRVSFAGIVKEVNLAYVPEARIGDYVMVHVGFAISTVDRDEALRVFEYLDQIDELQELRAAQDDGHLAARRIPADASGRTSEPEYIDEKTDRSS